MADEPGKGVDPVDGAASAHRPLARWAVVAVLAIALVAAGFLAGRLTLTPPRTEAQASDDQILVAVQVRTIGQTLEYGGRTSRATTPVATNALAGVVTSVGEAVAERRQGDVLYSVDGVPVRVVQGAEPFYRALAEGTQGVDVLQLEQALVSLGYLPAADQTFDAATTKAVADWQRALGLAPTGTVPVGELVAVPRLPASVTLDTKALWRGAQLGGGEVLVSMGTGEPVFTLPLSPGQVNLVPPEAEMVVEGFGQTWPARWASSQQDAELGVGQVVTLAAPDGGPVCGASCDKVPAEPSWVTVRIEVVPQTTGPAVPVSAVSTDPARQAWVTVVSDGVPSRQQVTVKRSHAGLAVVEGVEAGQMVQAMAEPSAVAQSPSDPPAPPSRTP